MALRLAVLAGFGTAALAVSGLFDPVPYNRYSVAASVFIVSVTVSFAALSTLKIVAHSPLWIVVPCLLATALLPVWVVIGVTGMGYRSLDEMDFDEDGRTSLVEIVTAMNVVRVRSRDRPGCFEYIDAKAASETYRVTCNDFR